MDLRGAHLIGDDPAGHTRPWAKPRDWWGRCNREWRVALDDGPARRIELAGDTLRFAKHFERPGKSYSASVRVIADGAAKAYLWTGARGRLTVFLNGQQVMREENVTRYRIGQFERPVQLRSGENQLLLRLEPTVPEPQLSALLCGRRNDGDSLEGIRWTA
jgi:hypothetical protein